MGEKDNKGNFINKNIFEYFFQNKEIELNFKTMPLIILFIIICAIVGSLIGALRGYLWTLKPNFIWTVIFFIFSFVAFIYSIVKVKNLKTILLSLFVAIAFFINIFHPIFK